MLIIDYDLHLFNSAFGELCKNSSIFKIHLKIFTIKNVSVIFYCSNSSLRLRFLIHLMENSMQLLKSTRKKTELPCETAMSVLGVFPKEVKSYMNKILVPPVHCNNVHKN